MQVLQSNKWTFSLACFVMLLAIGLVVVSPATAAVLDENFGVTFGVTDVSSEGGIQVQLDDPAADPGTIAFSVTFSTEVKIGADLTTGADNTLENADFVTTVYDNETGLLSADVVEVAITGAAVSTATKEVTVTLSGAGVSVGNTIFVLLAKGALENANQADVIKAATSDDTLGKNNLASLQLMVVGADGGAPTVLAIAQVAASTPGFTPAGVRGQFSVQVLLSEKPKEFKVDHIMVTNGKVDSVVEGTAEEPVNNFGGEAQAAFTATNATGRGTATTGEAGARMLQPYLVTITPDLKKEDDVVISVKEFDDMVIPVPNKYRPDPVAMLDGVLGGTGDDLGNQKLMVPVDKTAVAAAPDVFKPSNDAKLPHEKFLPEKQVIPANGYLVLASGTFAQAGIQSSPAKIADKKREGQTLYNSVEKFDPPYPGDDLANYFRNGATIQLIYKDIAGNAEGANADTGYAGATSATVAAGDVVINEIMWGHDRGLDERAIAESQWIELHNTTAAAISIDKNEWVLAFGSSTSLTGGVVVDRVTNNPALHDYWVAPGQSGATKDIATVTSAEAIAAVTRDLQDLVSMSRIAGAPDGSLEASWAMSILPAHNMTGNRIGSPGAENEYDMSAMDKAAADKAAADKAAADKAAADKAAAEAAKPASATKDEIKITEIMVDSGNGRFPQWIELTNVAATEVSLDGWKLSIMNDPADAEVVGSSLMIDLDGITLDVSKNPGNLGKGQSLLIVAFSGRGSDNLFADPSVDKEGVAIVDASGADQLNQVGRYLLLSETAFKLALMPPQTTGITVYGDTAGNLDAAEAWDLEMAEGMRSSLIRREMDAAKMATMGTEAKGWRLASETDLASGQITWYGSDEDAGTPGYDAGGPLPVELSMFYPTRDRLTGQVVITWETQSELNNAGFFIKRSEAKNGKFMVINPQMIAGAGTTSEKQSYTYTDTTAKPNVVYYYQIEDVSLDGQRQTLTLGTRLRGHIGAAGKATTTWGELKAQE